MDALYVLFQASRAKMASTKPLTFKVTRKNPELILPAEPTPHEFKFLSDIDDQDILRCQIPSIFFYHKNTSMEGKDPVNVIRDAVAKALVFYYPLAGRLRECPGRKLVVECTGQGVLFIEADADVMMEQFEDLLHPPFPNMEELLHDVPGSNGIINCPLLLIQVTRLRCGGFISAYRFNHTMCDGAGILHFMTAASELARGATVPSTPPVWQRHLLRARDPPRVSFTHHVYDLKTSGTPVPVDKMVQRSFFFSATDIAALRRRLPLYLQNSSKFDVVVACAWRCWTIAVPLKPDEETVLFIVVDIRKRMNPPLPLGYYGNAIVSPAAITTVEKLCKNPLHYAVELVRKAKYEVTDEYVRSNVDRIVGRDTFEPSFAMGMSYWVSDLTHGGFEQVDFGWGKAAYGGIAKGIADWLPTPISWYIPCKNKMGEEGILVPVCLPPNAMEEFAKELQIMMKSARTNLPSTVSSL